MSNSTLILLRHGQSLWNLENRFTGWYDCPLSGQGIAEAKNAGALIAEAGLFPDSMHTSWLQRASKTADLALAEMRKTRDLTIPEHSSWRLNERHYGDLTGLDKAETAAVHGDGQVHVWRRSYSVRPPPISADNPFNPSNDPKYRELPEELMPATESLEDVHKRLMVYFNEDLARDLKEKPVFGNTRTVLVAAHGNSLRAMVKHLDNISDEDISELNIPTGVPLIYELTANLMPVEIISASKRYLQ